MNTILNSYSTISNTELYSRIAFYESDTFLQETTLLMIPDVVQYVRNIFESLRYAEQSRLIVEDVANQIIEYRNAHGHVVNSSGYKIGTLFTDSRAYAQRIKFRFCLVVEFLIWVCYSLIYKKEDSSRIPKTAVHFIFGGANCV